MKSLRLHLTLTDTGTANVGVSYARFMVLYDRNANGGYIASNVILSDSTQNNTITNGDWNSSLNPNFFDRFVVLMDEMLILPPWVSPAGATYTTGPTETQTFEIDRFIKLKNLETIYNNTSNPMTIGNITTGALEVLCFGDTAEANSAWALEGKARLRFRDN